MRETQMLLELGSTGLVRVDRGRSHGDISSTLTHPGGTGDLHTKIEGIGGSACLVLNRVLSSLDE